MKTIREHWLPALLFAIAAIIIVNGISFKEEAIHAMATNDSTWYAPSLFLDNTTQGEERQMLIYGEQLVSNTAYYLGPKGVVSQTTNGMNCQNCHMNAGRKSWGNNYGAVASTYPKYRDRSGRVENIYMRVNDCMERSLAGKMLDTNSKEMRAIAAYILWVGKDVEKGRKPHGSGIEKLAYMDRAADMVKGNRVYINQCQSCHGADGAGQLAFNERTYATPPVWGEHSYNDGAGLYRVSNLAGFVKNNMPFNKASHTHPILTNEEAWDVAAFINSQPRPHKEQSRDWPDITKKPVDHPLGPYADTFTERQHKYGPFKPIEQARKKFIQHSIAAKKH